ncbi:MAG: Nif3-like dinuclear metal center hexameric protein, partial [Firmicutes bacterium]|nr:Nif3-like dinuclear metal center hexameric protein [Bacillota bacterium]
KLIKNDISAICMHTNLDIAQGGVNDALMSALGGCVSGFLEPCGIDADGTPIGCGRIGELTESIDFQSFLRTCKEALHVNGLRYHDAGRPVKKLAVMGGSGGDCIALAESLGCDTYVTADIKYNGFLDAKELGLNLIDADHFCTENVVIPVLQEKLSAKFEDVDFSISSVHCQTAQFY